MNLRHSVEIKGIPKTLNENCLVIIVLYNLLPKLLKVTLSLIRHIELRGRRIRMCGLSYTQTAQTIFVCQFQ